MKDEVTLKLSRLAAEHIRWPCPPNTCSHEAEIRKAALCALSQNQLDLRDSAKKEDHRYGGWSLCDQCGQSVTIGEVCQKCKLRGPAWRELNELSKRPRVRPHDGIFYGPPHDPEADFMPAKPVGQAPPEQERKATRAAISDAEIALLTSRDLSKLAEFEQAAEGVRIGADHSPLCEVMLSAPHEAECTCGFSGAIRYFDLALAAWRKEPAPGQAIDEEQLKRVCPAAALILQTVRKRQIDPVQVDCEFPAVCACLLELDAARDYAEKCATKLSYKLGDTEKERDEAQIRIKELKAKWEEDYHHWADKQDEANKDIIRLADALDGASARVEKAVSIGVTALAYFAGHPDVDETMLEVARTALGQLGPFCPKKVEVERRFMEHKEVDDAS